MYNKIGVFVFGLCVWLFCAHIEGAVAGELIKKNNLKYLGAFKVPWEKQGCDSWTACAFGYGGNLIAFNPMGGNGKGSLFLGGNIQAQKVAEISIPPLVNSTKLSSLNTAKVLQGFYDITEGNQNKILEGGALYPQTVYKGGLLVYGSKLIGTVYTYYPGKKQMLSHYTSSLDLSAKGDFSGMYQVGNSARMAGGYMTQVPKEWQSALGGPVLTGQAALPVISTTSSGPSAFAFDPADLGIKSPVPAVPLVYYPITNPLAKPDTANPIFNVCSQIKGLVFPAGTDSILFFGSHGMGNYCYGEATRDPALADTGVPGKPASKYCYDPASSAKGPHMYPYKYQVWAYDVADFVKVKRGGNKPWEIRPYEIWNFELPFQPANAEILGAAYDERTGRIFLSQAHGNGKVPVIHVFEVILSHP